MAFSHEGIARLPYSDFSQMENSHHENVADAGDYDPNLRETSSQLGIFAPADSLIGEPK